jgi:acyl carrier protein
VKVRLNQSTEKKQEILENLASAIQMLMPKQKVTNLSMETVLAGEGGILDSITILGLVAWVDDTYHTDVLDGDLDMESLATIGSLAERIMDLI